MATDSIIDAIEEPALLVAAGEVSACNDAARELLGQRLVGSDIRLVIRQPRALDLVMSGRKGSVEVEGIGRAERPWRVTAFPLAGGRTLIRLIDRAAERMAERSRVDFVANASHELRTPLATILGYAETLAEDGPLPDDARQTFASTVQVEARRMLSIIEDLMGLSRIEAGRFRRPDDQVDLGELLADGVERAGELASRRKCEITVSIEQNLPTIAADAAQIAQLIDNLLGNAVRYGCSPSCNGVEASLSRFREKLRLEIRDHGDGIAPEHLPRLTERFYRVDPARSRESGGTGLGLAIVKHIAERHRATLDIASAIGRGTRVTVDFPY